MLCVPLVFDKSLLTPSKIFLLFLRSSLKLVEFCSKTLKQVTLGAKNFSDLALGMLMKGLLDLILNISLHPRRSPICRNMRL